MASIFSRSIINLSLKRVKSRTIPPLTGNGPPLSEVPEPLGKFHLYASHFLLYNNLEINE